MNPLPFLTSRRMPVASAPERAGRAHPPPEERVPRTSTKADVSSLVEEHADLLVWQAFRLLGSMPDAEDVVQDVFVKVFAAGRGAEVASIRPYLYRAVANACTDRLRARKRTTRLFEPVEVDGLATHALSPPECAAALEESVRIEALLATLPREQAEVIRLRVLDGLRLDEIALVLECPINTVSSRLRYGFQKLRESLGRKEETHELP